IVGKREVAIGRDPSRAAVASSDKTEDIDANASRISGAVVSLNASLQLRLRLTDPVTVADEVFSKHSHRQRTRRGSCSTALNWQRIGSRKNSMERSCGH